MSDLIYATLCWLGFFFILGLMRLPMGADSDPTAVVDAWGKVRVVDASTLPDIPSVPTNVTTISLMREIDVR
jgi:GMC oxidoreductase